MITRDKGKKIWNQEIHFENGSRRRTDNVVDVWQGEWYHIYTKDGQEFIINPDKVLYVKVWTNKK